MNKQIHHAIFTTNRSFKDKWIYSLLKGNEKEFFSEFTDLKGGVYSKKEIDKFVDLEERLEIKKVTRNQSQSLRSMSTGEQKKALLSYLLSSDVEYLVLDDPFGGLDTASQANFKQMIAEVSHRITIIQLVNRKEDLLDFCTEFYSLSALKLTKFSTSNVAEKSLSISTEVNISKIPLPLHTYSYEGTELVSFKNVFVSFLEKQVLKNINWTINKGEFWQLVGPNGSGKSTLISMITGDSPKGYNKELYLFGRKKGTGESIWSIKDKIGYFSPSLVYNFKGHHSILNMVIAGFNDSVGLYVKPTEIQLQLAKEWLQLIDLWHLKDAYFSGLSMGQQRLVMCARAMVKHPLLLILDEPTVGLDDESARLFVELVNKIAAAKSSTIVYVSHRKEAQLSADYVYQLHLSSAGSEGQIVD